MLKNIELAFISDDNYAMPLIVAIISLKCHLNPAYQYHVHVICEDMSSKNRLLLQSLAEQNLCMDIINVGEGVNHQFDKACLHASSAAMQKFNLPLILKNLDKVLYLDSDIIIQNDLVAFFNLDITEYYCAAVPDGPRNTFIYGSVWYDLILKPGYFNSGVLLLNLQLLRQHDMTSKLIEYKKNGNNYFMDQDALNVVLGNKVLLLPLYYCVMLHLFSPEWEKSSVEELSNYYHMKPVDSHEYYFENGYILHYSYQKPWQYYDILLAGRWLYYYKKSPLANVKLYRESYYKIFYNNIREGKTFRVGAFLLYIPKKIKRLLKSVSI